MRLYTMPGGCALACRTVLEGAGASHESGTIERAAPAGDAHRAVHPKGGHARERPRRGGWHGRAGGRGVIEPGADEGTGASRGRAAGGADAPSIRLLPAEDHHLVRRALVALLGREPSVAVVTEAGDGPRAVAPSRATRPDVSPLDPWMPGLDGVGATRARVVVLTTFDAEDGIVAAVWVGACACSLKDVAPEEPIGCPHRVHAGAADPSPVPSASGARAVGCRAPPRRGGLTGARLRRVRDHAEAHLERELSSAELAAVAGLSEGHFRRAFRQSTGRSPRRWLTERRVERAKRLLEDRRLGLAEIALMAGYASQSHLTERFRDITGTTPARWRRDTLG